MSFQEKKKCVAERVLVCFAVGTLECKKGGLGGKVLMEVLRA